MIQFLYKISKRNHNDKISKEIIKNNIQNQEEV